MSVTSTYGANIAFIEELWEKFRNDPNSVSPSWREFFQDYQPQLADELADDGQQPAAEAPASLPAGAASRRR